MFKRSRRRIVATIMSILIVLWAGTLGIIYATSYHSMQKDNRELLQMHAERYRIGESERVGPTTPQSAAQTAPPTQGSLKDGRRSFDSPRFQTETFLTVAVSKDGEVLETVNRFDNVYTDSELEELAQSIVSENKETGKIDNLVYLKTDKETYTLVTFIDNTVQNENTSTLFKYTLIIGAAALVVFFFVSVYLARKIVEPLEESYEKQKQFISDAGHELKTPVAVVNANAELLEREIGENTWLSNIRYENERMGNLVTQLLDLARLEHVETQKEEVNFSRIVAGESLPFESVAFEKGMTLESDIENDINIDGNSAQLKQLVSILIDNALRHSTGPVVTVSLKKDRNDSVLTVANEGEEIPPDNREKIFERFYRAEEARTDSGNNYGLGLAIAKSIAEGHGGSIKVECENGIVKFIAKI